MAEATDDYPAHLATYTSFNKLVTFGILWIVLLLVSMALGLVGHLPLLGLLLGVGGSIALLIAFAVLN
ncbi:MAG: aa3-type cytochrome c oxidase subunit IV [Reyranella sp.]|uniref:aa3-type cytochrome c oxidase subunit IV n=1 Tax=Reyranella sp. TaxID=1929291 RepID=UPI0012149A71|nr:aa3-type cytochrome c oxidase subunit IV [Reyranella sp.]TAJ92057.1 MAG: aa3-type cytochrome c oxidase subunit IV [Reyranella sp.]TBR28327.1 MAG: aa3-type cytochrome c oxidase subunit IV [Reyranella sp.]